MRGLFVSFGAVLLIACVQIGPDAGSGGGDVSTDCDNKNDCSACTLCSDRQICAQEKAVCDNNSACIGIIQCLNLCSDAACEDQCFAANQNGIAAFNAYVECSWCGACPSDCAGLASCS